MTTMEAMETEQLICSAFSLPKICYPRFNKFQKQLLNVGQELQVTLEEFHKLTQTEVSGNLYKIKQTVKNITDAPEVQVAIFGKFHDDMSSHNLVTAKDGRYLNPDCAPSRLIRNECTDMFMQSHDGKGKPVAYVYIVYVDENDILEELAPNIQKDIEFLGLPSLNNLLLLVGLDPSLEREDSALKSFETALTNIFHETTEGKPYDEFHVFFKSCTYEECISSEGELPKLIQLHLEWKVIQLLQDMKELIETNFRTYKKNSEATIQGPHAVKESLQERLLETFKNHQLMLDILQDILVQQKGEMDRESIVKVILKRFKRILHCIMVEDLAKKYGKYGIREYHLSDTLFREKEFMKECQTIIENWIKKDIIPSLHPALIKYPYANLKNDEEKAKFRKLIFEAHQESFDKFKKMVDKDLMIIVCRVHEELEKRFIATEGNLAIQQKLKLEIESILMQTDASNYESYCNPSQANLATGLNEDLLKIEDRLEIVMLCGQLHVHISKFQSSDKEEASVKQIHDALMRHKYWQKYKVCKMQSSVETEMPPSVQVLEDSEDDKQESDVINQQSDDGHQYELSWDGFPRVNGFLQRLKNLYDRYKRTTVTYSDLIKESHNNHWELESRINSLKTGPKILVFGEMFERITVKALVRNEKQLGNNYLDKSINISNWREHTTEASTSFPIIVVLAARLENENDFSKCAQMLDHNLDKLVQHFHHSQSETILSILCAIETDPSIQENSEQLERFRCDFKKRFSITLQDFTMAMPCQEDCIIFWHSNELSKAISDHLELHVVSCLRSLEENLKVNFHHRIQSSVPYDKSKFMNMIEQDLVSLMSIDGGIISKIQSEIESKEETLPTDTLKTFVFDAQIHVAKRRIEELSSSFGIQTKLIEEILNKINFKEECKTCIQDSTVQKLTAILGGVRVPEERDLFTEYSLKRKRVTTTLLYL